MTIHAGAHLMVLCVGFMPRRKKIPDKSLRRDISSQEDIQKVLFGLEKCEKRNQYKKETD